MTDILTSLVKFILSVFQILIWSVLMFTLFLILTKGIRRVFKTIYKKEIPRPATSAHIMNSFIRRALQPPKSVIKELDVKNGMVILEIGAGGGTYTFEAARSGEDITVYATDIMENMLDVLKSNMMKTNLSNIIPEIANVYQLPYEENMFDRAFMVTVTGELNDKISAFKEIFRVLKPGGKLLIGEFLIDPDYPLKRSVKKWCKKAGFKFMKSRERIMHYTMVFQKDEPLTA